MPAPRRYLTALTGDAVAAGLDVDRIAASADTITAAVTAGVTGRAVVTAGDGFVHRVAVIPADDVVTDARFWVAVVDDTGGAAYPWNGQLVTVDYAAARWRRDRDSTGPLVVALLLNLVAVGLPNRRVTAA